ncbi:homogentisate 1,2-dioxygenase [Sphingomonas sp. ac-8]|uniref:homogentisate 1,2-dioxygenase n=1 Tax=Sphingomonas sp. ac-8 TaxID=3242977 RepID=UPI003A807E9D
MLTTPSIFLALAQALMPQPAASPPAPNQSGARAVAAQPCTAAEPLPAALAAWSRPERLSAGIAQGASLPVLRVGRAATLRLQPAASLRLVRVPATAPADARGGMVAFTVGQAGHYRVALESKGWIDVLKDGQPLESSSHGHGPRCTGIRKLVGFTLQPGRYVLQLSNVPQDAVRVLIARS